MLPCVNATIQIKRRSATDTYTKEGDIVHVLGTADYRCFFTFYSDATTVSVPEGQVFNTADGLALCDGVVIAEPGDKVLIAFDSISGAIPVNAETAENDLTYYNMQCEIMSVSPIVGPIAITEVRVKRICS